MGFLCFSFFCFYFFKENKNFVRASKETKSLNQKISSKFFFLFPERFFFCLNVLHAEKYFFFTINSENKISTFKITKNRFTFLITFNFFIQFCLNFSSFCVLRLFFCSSCPKNIFIKNIMSVWEWESCVINIVLYFFVSIV